MCEWEVPGKGHITEACNPLPPPFGASLPSPWQEMTDRTKKGLGNNEETGSEEGRDGRTGEWRVQEASRLMQADKGRPRELAAGAGAGDKGMLEAQARVGALRTEED